MNAPFDSDNLNWAAEFGRELAKEVKEHIARVVKPLQNRIAQLEAGVR